MSSCRRKCCVCMVRRMSCHSHRYSEGFVGHNSESVGYWQPGTTMSDQTTTDAQAAMLTKPQVSRLRPVNQGHGLTYLCSRQASLNSIRRGTGRQWSWRITGAMWSRLYAPCRSCCHLPGRTPWKATCWLVTEPPSGRRGWYTSLTGSNHRRMNKGVERTCFPGAEAREGPYSGNMHMAILKH